MAIPYIEIDLDKPRRLRFGTKAIYNLQKLTNLSITKIAKEFEKGAEYDFIVQVLLSMLRANGETMSIDTLYDIIDNTFASPSDAIEKTTKAVTDAVAAAFPEGDGKNA